MTTVNPDRCLARPTLPSGSSRVAWLAAVAVALWMAAMPRPAAAQAAPQPKLPTVTLTAGMHVIVAEIASTPLQRQIGMMMRTEMGANEGMLFVFENPERQCFWMRNTLLPLSAAFIADDGRVVNIVEMKPRTDDSHCSAAPVRYVLEMNKGWFERKGIRPGDRLRGKPFGG